MGLVGRREEGGGDGGVAWGGGPLWRGKRIKSIRLLSVASVEASTGWTRPAVKTLS